MREMRPIVLLTSAAALMLALGQGVRAELIVSDAAEAPAAEASAPAAPTESAPAAAPAPEAASTQATPAETASAEAPPGATSSPEAAPAAAAPQPPAPPSPADAARKRMEQREAEMMGQRRLRYDELRTRAAEVGLDLPETPPWEQAGVHPMEMPTPPDMPEPPEMPAPPEMPQAPGMTPRPGPETGAGTSPDEIDAMREQRYQDMRERAKRRGVEMPETPPWKLMNKAERQAHWEMMRNMTPEQRQAMREAHWQEMRERAKAQGIEMPELPPWKQAEQRRQEMQAQWEKYRSIVDQMSEEQREAAEAVFSQATRQRPPSPMQQPMPPRMPMQAPYGPSYGVPRGSMMPGYGGQGAGPGMSDWGAGDPWSGGDEGMYQAPTYPEAGYNQPW